MIVGGQTDGRHDVAVQGPFGDRLARLQNGSIGGRARDPSQVKENWQPVSWLEPWNTTPQIDFGNAGWRTRLSTVWATASCPGVGSSAAS